MNDGRTYITGVMTGTSADGVDISLLSFKSGSQIDWEIVSSSFFPFPRRLFGKIIEFQEKESMNKRDYLRFSAMLGYFVAGKVSTFLGKCFVRELPPNMAIAYHGQTIAHYPRKQRIGQGRFSSTLQAGESAMISRLSGLTVVSDFRQADIAAGGFGAPLTPPFHACLLAERRGTNAFLNIGGIGNVTVVRKGNVVTASDTGPGNMLIDGAVRRITGGKSTYDRDGKIARKGVPSDKLITCITERDDFFRKRKPASTGREQYGKSFLKEILTCGTRLKLSGEDIVATLTRYTAICVADFFQKKGLRKLSKVYVGGGGVKNSSLMSALKNTLPAEEVVSSHALGVDPDFVESSAFAYLGYCALIGVPLDMSNITGGGKTVLGKITPGSNFPELMRYLHQS